MKKTLFILLLATFSLATSQTYTPINNYGQTHQRIKVTGNFKVPFGSVFLRNTNDVAPGDLFMYINADSSALGYYDGSRFKTFIDSLSFANDSTFFWKWGRKYFLNKSIQSIPTLQQVTQQVGGALTDQDVTFEFRTSYVDQNGFIKKARVNANNLTSSIEQFTYTGTGGDIATRQWTNNQYLNVAYTNQFNTFTTRTRFTSLLFNKDSVPIITGGRWGFVLDTTDNQLKRQLLLNYNNGVAGRVPFFTDANTISSDSTITWNNATKRLGINITPIDKVHIGGNKINTLMSPEFTGLTVSDMTSAAFGCGGGIIFRGNHSGTTYSTTAGVIQSSKENATPGDYSFAMTFHTRLNGTSQWPESVRITSDGNLLINTKTNAGFRADINGTARIVGKLTQPTTANSPKGTATLVNGVVTISNTLATTGCFIQVNYRTATALSGTSSILTVSSLVNATSFTVTAYTPGAATTNTSDNNTIEYTISN